MLFRSQLDSGSGVPAGTKSESDTFTDVDLHTAESSVTPGLVGFRMPVSDEAAVQSLAGVQAGALVEAIRALEDRIDTDILAGSASATSIVGAAADDLTLTKFRAACATYKATDPMGADHACVLSHTCAGDLLDSLHATGASFARSAGDSFDMKPVAGYLGKLHGFDCFESGNVADNGSGADSNFMTPIGHQKSGLGLVEIGRAHV